MTGAASPTTGRDAAARAPDARVGYDFWTALLAGEAAWSDATERPTPRARLAAVVQVVALAVVALQVWVVVPLRIDDAARPALLWAAAATVTLAAAAFAYRPLTVAVARAGLGPPSRAIAWRSTWRLLASVMIVAGSVIVMPRWLAVGLWPLGVATGADVALTGWALGVHLRPAEWWVRFISSPVHLGGLGAIAAVALTRSDSGVVVTVVALYLALQVAALAAWITTYLLIHVTRSIESELVLERSRREEAEHRRLAHWIHDDVCADLQLTALRLRTGRLTPESVADELDELDHRLRLRQQQEIIGSGKARLAELLQPYVRRAQQAGVSISEVPTLDDASLRVDEHTATLFARAVSTLTSNALNAGATTVGLRVRHDQQVISLSVTDDAGGFDLAGIPAGRGLDMLVADLGRDNLSVEHRDGGSVVTVTIPHPLACPDRSDDGPDPAR